MSPSCPDGRPFIRSAFQFPPERVQPAELTSAAGSRGSAALWLPSRGLRPRRRTPAERTQPAGWRHKQRDMSQCLTPQK